MLSDMIKKEGDFSNCGCDLCTLVSKILPEAEKQESLIKDMIIVLERCDQFISNGIEFNYIRMPDKNSLDTALETPRKIYEIIQKAKEVLK